MSCWGPRAASPGTPGVPLPFSLPYWLRSLPRRGPEHPRAPALPTRAALGVQGQLAPGSSGEQGPWPEGLGERKERDFGARLQALQPPALGLGRRAAGPLALLRQPAHHPHSRYGAWEEGVEAGHLQRMAEGTHRSH